MPLWTLSGYKRKKLLKLGFYLHMPIIWHIFPYIGLFVVAHSRVHFSHWQLSSPLALGASAASACRRALGHMQLVYVLRVSHWSQVICTIFGACSWLCFNSSLVHHSIIWKLTSPNVKGGTGRWTAFLSTENHVLKWSWHLSITCCS